VILSVISHGLAIGLLVFSSHFKSAKSPAPSARPIDTRIPLTQLFAAAHSRLHPMPSPALSESLGEWIINCEFYPLQVLDRKLQVQAIAGYQQQLNDLRNLISAEPEPLARVELVRRLIWTTQARQFCSGNSNLASIYLSQCSNNEALSRLLIGLLVDLDMTQIGEFSLGLQIHRDSISAVYWNSQRKTLVDLSTGLISRSDGSPIFKPNALPLALLDFYHQHETVQWQDLLIEPSPLALAKGTPSPVALSNFVFPDVGQTCFFEADSSSGCIAPVATGTRIYHPISPHRADTTESRYQYLQIRNQSWNWERPSFHYAVDESFDRAFVRPRWIADETPKTTVLSYRNPHTFLEGLQPPGVGKPSWSREDGKASQQQESVPNGSPQAQPRENVEGQGGGTGRGEGDFEKTFAREWEESTQETPDKKFKHQKGGQDVGEGQDPNGDMYAKGAEDPYGLKAQKKNAEKVDVEQAQAAYDNKKYGQLSPLTIGSYHELLSHMTGLPVTADDDMDPRTPQYMEDLSTDSNAVVLPPVRLKKMSDALSVDAPNGWLGLLLTSAYKRLGFYFEARIDFGDELRGRIRNINGKKFIVLGNQPVADHGLYIEPQKLFMTTADPQLESALSETPNIAKAHFVDAMKTIFFDPLKLPAPRVLLAILSHPLVAPPNVNLDDLVDQIHHWAALKTILDDWRRTGLIYFLARYGLPAEEFYKTFYDVNADVFQLYAQMIDGLRAHPLDSVRQLEALSETDRHRLFFIYSVLKEELTMPLWSTPDAKVQQRYLKRSESEIASLQSRWQQPFAALLEELLRADQWMVKENLDLSKYQIVEVELGKPLMQVPPRPQATPTNVLLILPDVLWMILHLQNDELTLHHFRIQYEVLKRLTQPFYKSVEGYLSRSTMGDFATLFLHHGEPLGSIGDLIAKNLKRSPLPVLQLGSLQFYVMSPVENFFKAILPIGYEVHDSVAVPIHAVSPPRLTVLSGALHETSSTEQEPIGNFLGQTLVAGPHLWVAQGFDASAVDKDLWQVEIDLCSQQIQAYRNQPADGFASLAKWVDPKIAKDCANSTK
jgi:hypothetical protein